MIKQIKMKYFRRHEDRTVNFAEGLNVVRAANEGGKSTTIEAALYALYGAKALRSTLAEAVTWGRSEKDLEVELILEIEGRLFKFSRSKSGAECNYDGGIITGQSEVTKFAEEIMSADANTANQLMLANQNNMRGMLEEGPSVVSAMIEGLADFDLFDRIMDAADRKLLTGSTKLLESKLVDAEQQLESVIAVAPDLKQFDLLAEQFRELSATKQVVLEKYEPILGEAQNKLASLEATNTHRNYLLSVVEKLNNEVVMLKNNQKDFEDQASVEVSDAEMNTLRKSILSIESEEKRVKAFKLVNELGTYPEIFWEGSKESFLKERSDLRLSLAELKADINTKALKVLEADRAIAELEKHLNHDGNCHECGQTLPDSPERKLREEQARQQIDQYQHDISENEIYLKEKGKVVLELELDISALNDLENLAGKYELVAARCADFILVDTDVYPSKIVWNASDSIDVEDVSELKVKLSLLEQKKKSSEAAKVRLGDIGNQISTKEVEASKALKEANALEVSDLSDLKGKVAEYTEIVGIARFEVQDAERKARAELENKERAQLEYQHALEKESNAKEVHLKALKDLNDLNFNNHLLKQVRAARPIISDKLWNTVLQSVSAMFSQMRGETSIVSKGKDGFSVNGANVASLSGSTLDLLGLALRCSLVKSFLPYVSMLVLDEPAAAMDDERATKMLGFIAAAGFQQTILITHEEVSEQFADHLITL